MVEITIIKRSTIPNMPWCKILRYKAKRLNGESAIMLLLPRVQSPRPIQDAWRTVAHENHKEPFNKMTRHQLGKTLYLWWE